MAVQTQLGDVNNKRFQDAKERYFRLNQNSTQETLQTRTDNSDEVYLSQAVDYLKQMADREYSPIKSYNTVANQNKLPGLPVPLPVKPIAPEQIIEQAKTNELIKSLNKNISKEITLKSVANALIKLNETIIWFVDQLTSKFGSVSTTFSDDIDRIIDEDKKRDGWATKLISKVLGKNEKMISLADAFQKYTKPLVASSKNMVDILSRTYKLLAGDSNKTSIEANRDLLGDSNKVGAFSGLFDKIFDKDSNVASAVNVVKKISEFFEKIGEFGEKALGNIKVSGIISALAGSGVVVKFLGLFGGIAGFITTVVGGAVFASVYSFFKNPDQLVRLLAAFKTLFTEVIVPTMDWIVKNVIPPLTVAFGALMFVADKLLDVVGTAINETLIWIIGTGIPVAFKSIVFIFSELYETIKGWVTTAWNTVKDVSERIAGIFGIGKYANDGIFTNIQKMFWSIADGILEILAVFPTSVLRMLNLDDLIGMKDDESLYGRIKRFIGVEIPEFVVTLFNKTMEYIKKLNPLGYIQSKFQEVIDYFTGGDEELSIFDIIKTKVKETVDSITGFFSKLIPSWDEVKGWLLDIIPGSGVASFIRDKFKAALDYGDGVSPQPVQRDIQSRADNLPLDPWARGVGGSMTVVAPTGNVATYNFAGSMALAQAEALGIGTTTPPSSRLDDMIYRAY